MSARAPIVSALIILSASALSLWRDLRNEADFQATMGEWARAQQTIAARSPMAPAPTTYWRWRALQKNNLLEQLAEADPWAVFSAGAGQEVWAINAAAKHHIDDIPVSVMPLVAISTASFLGIDIDEEPEAFGDLSDQIVGSLNPWRAAMAERCGDCAPPAAPFPAASGLLTAGSQGLEPRGSTGISIAVEQHRRTAMPMQAPPSQMAAMVMRIREGGSPTAKEWATPGLAGMAALELGASRDQKWAPTLLQLARTGPSGTDQIAALWAAKSLGVQDPLIERIEAAL